MSDYLESVEKQFLRYKQLGEKTISQLEDQDLFWRYNEDSNSIAIIVKHLWGNMLSRWTDFLTSDGEKEWRERDEEFEGNDVTREEIIKQWDEGWKCLFNALSSVNEDNFNQTVYIRDEAHTIMDAFNRQLAHYCVHIGQIMFIGKMIKGKEWQSLSIPKGKSKEFNKEKRLQSRQSQAK